MAIAAKKEPMRSHPAKPAIVPVTPEPKKLPKSARRMRPAMITKKSSAMTRPGLKPSACG